MNSALKVLYVDEQATPLEPLKLLLEMTADMQVEVASTLKEGMAMISDGQIDVVIYGCRKGDNACIEYLRKLRIEGHDIPVVMLSDAYNEKLRDEALKLSNIAYMSRGDNPTKELILLTETIRGLLGRNLN